MDLIVNCKYTIVTPTFLYSVNHKLYFLKVSIENQNYYNKLKKSVTIVFNIFDFMCTFQNEIEKWLSHLVVINIMKIIIN